MDIGFVTGELNYRAISDLSAGIETLPAFRSLMEDGSGERLAQYAKRVKQMKSREEERSTAESAKAGPDAPER